MNGLEMAARRKVPQEVRAQIMADLASGESMSAVARKYGVSKSTASCLYYEVPVVVGASQAVGRNRADDVLDLAGLMQRLLTAKLETAIQIQEFARSREWLEKQDAQQLAVFAGVNEDKVIRLIESLLKQQQSAVPNKA